MGCERRYNNEKKNPRRARRGTQKVLRAGAVRTVLIGVRTSLGICGASSGVNGTIGGAI